MTIDQLHKHITNCFKVTKNSQLLEDIDKEGMQGDRAYTMNAVKDMPTVEHIWNTYDWTALLLDEKNPDGRAFCNISNIAQLREPDVFRPHYWEFTILGDATVLNVKHFTKDKEYWNKTPMPLWQRVPNLHDLKPCILGHTSPFLTDLYAKLAACNARFLETGARCHGGDKGQKSAKACCRCLQLEVVQRYVDMQAAMEVSAADLHWWETHFDKMTQEQVDATLPSLSDMVLPECPRDPGCRLPSVQEQINALPAMMKQAPVGLECKLVIAGWSGKAFKEKVTKIKRATAEVSVEGVEIESVVGVLRSGIEKVDYAVILKSGVGAWITDVMLSKCQRQAIALDLENPAQQWFGAGVTMRDLIVQEQSKRIYRASLSVYIEANDAWELQYPDQSANKIFGTWKCSAEKQTVDLQSLQIYGSAGLGNKGKGPKGKDISSTAKLVQWSKIKNMYQSGEWIEVQDLESEHWERTELFKHTISDQAVLWQPGMGASTVGTVEGLDPAYTLDNGILRDADGIEIKFRKVAQKKGLRENPKHDPEYHSSSSDSSEDSANEELIKDGCHRFWIALEHFGDVFIQDRIGPLLLSIRGEPINIANLQRCRYLTSIL
jgi:hypothetical protein